MNDPGRLWCLGSLSNGPLPHLISTSGEEAAQLQALTHSRDHFRKRRLGAKLLTLLIPLGIVFKARQPFLKTSGNRNNWVASRVVLDPFGNFGKVLIFLSDIILLAEIN